ncbi:hypothetical protein H9Q13_02915 [Pontibacter sp. JH31]|uniref:Uncharacterized protein n=1 Tax=Pontibacter aquaedesilientis TaxID=2766980 RepID=A0ABR7XCT5_9BACT|nr:hypothetical protein [Pontibacter aquaedesilientis]MBD1396105.1 hypothetical protein [Pontibacter aquaedesilientis]
MTIEHIATHNPIENFTDSLADRNLTRYASEILEQHGCSSLQDLRIAVKRATEVCSCMHMPLQENFKVVYRSRNGEVVQDWRLSPMAYLLTALNSDSRNTFVAQLQVEMVKRMLNQT